ncbi:nucleotidyltransferase family protein [Aestuariicella sp. G3-2]|uniref:nucleotidyltransferase domain-containing protein n=1 Tax=Pseudomaricurvus albidus TaxID=2842452 RepID=UPI001C0C67F4|nr:nucleotidyltransferase family protein [Aestuariicella albida]MBU3070865.1 nucleotidyltransferase family protein [Aestuariicella albida]
MKCLLLQILVNPESASRLTLEEWDLLIRQARSIDMLARLYVKLKNTQNGRVALPNKPVKHLAWSYKVTRRHGHAIRKEVEGLAESLEPLGVPVVLLKGAAYSYGELPPAEGRLFTDIDILLPEKVLPEAEQLLERYGWLSVHLDEYDQKYYRRWMHELPPLRHGKRETELDVHHAILPKTARVHPSSELLLEDITRFSEETNLYRLSDTDIILHSATHLFFDGEMQHGLRDLEDIASLLERFCTTETDWQALLCRGKALELSYPLFYALHYCHKWFKVAVPVDILKQAESATNASFPRRALMLWMFDRGLLPDHSSCYDRWTGLARWVLYVRSHYLKMPVHLLIPHLMYKSIWAPFKKRLEERKRERKPTTLDKLLEQQVDAKSR